MRRHKSRATEQTNPQTEALTRPDIFKYHDYRKYMKDWLAYLKASQSGLSLREIAIKVGISVSFLSMVIAGTRKLTKRTSLSLSPLFELTPTERLYLDLLISLADSDTPEERQEAYSRMIRMRSYQSKNPEENRSYQYFSHWYYVAIREMSALPDFEPIPEWVQPRLRFRVDLKEIERALKFLQENGFIQINKTGQIVPPQPVSLGGETYGLALARYHQEMLSLAGKSIESVPGDERNVLGYTLSVTHEQFRRIRTLLDDLYKKVEAIANESPSGESVVHVEMAMFPLSQSRKKEA